MTESVSPVVRGRRLAAALRGFRLASGRTIDEVAVHLECSAAKISRIENGLVSVRIQDARELLELYGVPGAEREDLLALARQARGRPWWRAYADLLAEGFDRVIGFEEEATDVWMLEARLVPGLVQTEEYAAALMASRRDVPPATVERLVRLRMERQAALRRRGGSVRFHLLLDEAALLRRVAPPEAMARQYLRLIEEARGPVLDLRVLSLAAQPHQAPGFSFTVFGFADPADPAVVFEELLEGTCFHESVETVGRYRFAFEHARSRALDAEASLDLLSGLAERCG